MALIKMKKKMPMMSDSDDQDGAPMSPKGAPSLAIALSVQKNTKKKKMAYGGEAVRNDGNPGTPMRKQDNTAVLKENYDNDKWTGSESLDDASSTSMAPAKSEFDGDKWAEGGMIDDMASHAEKAAFHRAEADKYQRMADGGEVSDNADESGQTPYASMNGDTYDNGEYDPNQLEDQPTDSNLMGDSHEMDSENQDDARIAAKIRKSLRAKRGY